MQRASESGAGRAADVKRASDNVDPKTGQARDPRKLVTDQIPDKRVEPGKNKGSGHRY